MQRKTVKSIISMLLVLVLLIGCFPITASAKTKITDIEISPITIVEGTFGDYDSNDGYFKYYPEDLLSYTIIFEDGQAYSDEGYSFDYNGESYWFKTETDQSLDNQWTAGNTYTMTVSLSGIEVDVPVTITDTVVASIDVEPISVIEYTNGVWEEDINNESGEYERSYYCYDLSWYVAGTVNFTDGTSTEFGFDGEFEYNNEKYWVSYTDNQSVQNPWTAGNEYSIKVEAMGVTENIPVTIEESPIESIELEPITVAEWTNGMWHKRRGEDWYIYSVADLFEYTVTFKNGDVLCSSGSGIEYDEEYYGFTVTDGQSFENKWIQNNTYTITAELMGCSAQTEVFVERSPIVSVEIEPIYVYEYTEGFWDGEYDFDTEEYTDEYYYYTPEDFMEYTVTFEDGNFVTGVGTEVDYNDDWYSFDVYTEQSYDNQWTVGNTYEMEVVLGGVKTVADVTIIESPIKSIELEPIELIENTSGYYESDYNEETEDYDLEYFCYYLDDHIKYNITLKDGTVVSGEGYSVELNSKYYDFEITTDQSYENAWEVGNTYKYIVSLMNIEAKGEVTIAESPIKNIEFEPLNISEGTCGLYTWDYNPKTEDWDLMYYEYMPWDKMEYTITFTDGSVEEWIGEEFAYDGVWYSFVIETDQAYDSQWTAGNTYVATLSVGGKAYELDITIGESIIESIEFEPVTVYNGINGYYIEEEDVNTGELVSFFCYEPLYVLEYTVMLKDGTVIEGRGDCFEYDGNWYELAMVDNQSAENIWEVGNTYSTEVFCMGQSFEIEVIVKDYIVGDVNCDGITNISDVTYIQKHLAGLVELDYTECMIADINEDWNVTIADATDIQKYLVGLI